MSRLCRHFGQCPERHAAPALRHFPADRREALVGRHPDRPLRRFPLRTPSNLSASAVRPSVCRRGACERSQQRRRRSCCPVSSGASPPAAWRHLRCRLSARNATRRVRRRELDDYVARAAAGDVRAFEHALSHAPAHACTASCAAWRGGRDADELTQDVFVRVWQKLGTFRGDSAFGTWLHRLAVNVVIERFRSGHGAAAAAARRRGDLRHAAGAAAIAAMS